MTDLPPDDQAKVDDAEAQLEARKKVETSPRWKANNAALAAILAVCLFIASQVVITNDKLDDLTAPPTTTSTTTTSTTTPPSSTTSTTAGPPPSSTTTTQPPGHQHPGLPVLAATICPEATWDLASSFFANGVIQQATDVAAFRTNVSYSHSSYDDPLVHPRRPGEAHFHQFYGNTSVDAFSTTMRTGTSTADGGTANNTGYWTPGVVDTRTDELITNFHSLEGQPNGCKGYRTMQVYYKRGYQGVRAGQITRWFPPELRMIAGSANRSEPTGNGNPVIQYTCVPVTFQGAVFGGEAIPGPAGNDGVLGNFDDCTAGRLFQMVIRFPQCWIGASGDNPSTSQDESLWRSDMSHMAYSVPGVGCPSSHPIALPEITEHLRIVVPPGNNRAGQPHDTRFWALTSDEYLGNGNPNGRAGYSGHADWWNGWDPDVGQAIIDGCYVPREFDCQFSIPGFGSPEQAPPPR